MTADAGDVIVDAGQNTVHVSKIFKWYSMDFGSQDDLLHWLTDYLAEEDASTLKSLLASQTSLKLKFKDYDWGQNSA